VRQREPGATADKRLGVLKLVGSHRHDQLGNAMSGGAEKSAAPAVVHGDRHLTEQEVLSYESFDVD